MGTRAVGFLDYNPDYIDAVALARDSSGILTSAQLSARLIS